MNFGKRADLYQLYTQIYNQREEKYFQGIANGTVRPFIWPWDTLPAVYLFLALLILPRLPKALSRWLRIPTVAVIFIHGINTCRSARTVGFASGYGIGLANAWGCVMTVVLLLTQDVKDLQRQETRQRKQTVHVDGTSNGSAVTSATAVGSSVAQDLRERKTAGAHEPQQETTMSPSISSSSDVDLVWQSYPHDLRHAADWILDLMTSFRGVNWNFRVTPKPEPTQQPTLSAIGHQALVRFIYLYLTLDILKTLKTHDVYFMGLPASQLPLLDTNHPITSPLLLRLLRLIISLASVATPLAFIFNLSPLFFTLLLPKIISPEQLSQVTHMPLFSPSVYPGYWHLPFPTLSTSGLAGFWGKVWHQMFRHGITQPSTFLIHRLNLDPKSTSSRIIQLFIAFFLTGSIHAAASYTSLPPHPDSNPQTPLGGPMVFFLCQGVGIVLQLGFSQLFKGREWPVWSRQIANTTFVVVWLLLTGPLLVDDFARCGIWLYEPLPISICRGLLGEGWWRWGGQWVGIWRDGWWSGIAIY